MSAIGLGGMPMSIEGRPDRERSIATIHASLDAGVTFIDTADAYHLHADEVGHNETLIAEALRSWGGDRDSVLVATKSGHLRPGDGSWTQDGRPEHIKAAAKASAQRLGVEAIGLHQFHRPDPAVPYAESVGALVELLDAGVIQMAGISNATPDQIREAQDVLGGRLVSVQNQYSPSFRSSRPELDLCDELGIAFLPWSPLGGISSAADLTPGLQPVRRGRRGARRHPAAGDPGLDARHVAGASSPSPAPAARRPRAPRPRPSPSGSPRTRSPRSTRPTDPGRPRPHHPGPPTAPRPGVRCARCPASGRERPGDGQPTARHRRPGDLAGAERRR